MRRNLFIITLFAGLSACQPPVRPLSGTGMDMFAPVSVRLHPFSSIHGVAASTRGSGPATQSASYVEARLEFTDQFGDITKAPATASLSLHDIGPLGNPGPELGTWSLAFDTPQANREHYDRITRTYVFNLPLPASFNPSQHQHLQLQLAVTLANNAHLNATLDLPGK